MKVSPPPTLVTRVFMLFRGVEEDLVDVWGIPPSSVDWATVVGVLDASAVCVGDRLRVLEWGGMEVYT